MLAKKNRLSRKDVLSVVSRGRSLRGKVLFLKYVSPANVLQAGVSVSKKVAKSAVARNRMRRAVYRAIASVKKDIPLARIFFSIQSRAEREVLEKDAIDLLRSAGLLSVKNT